MGNLFGDESVKESKLFYAVAQAFEKHEDGECSQADRNRMLMLAVGSYYENAEEACQVYKGLVSLSTVSRDTVPEYIKRLRLTVDSQVVDANKIPMIKELRSISGMSLKEAKEEVEKYFSFDSEHQVIKDWT